MNETFCHPQQTQKSIQSDAYVQCIVFPTTCPYQKIDVSIRIINNKPKNPSNPMHMYNALYFLQHTSTKKLMSLSGYCVPVKCCMFFVSRITRWLGTYKG